MNYFLKNKYFLVFVLFYFSIVISFFFGEDSLGGAKHDYTYHLKFVELFRENSLVDGLKKFSKSDYEARNSPIFYIVFSYLNAFISLEKLRILNSLISIFIAFGFFKCLELKFKNQSKVVLTLISCVIFLSPTVRSLSIWPYPLLWGIFFFIISIFYYLKFLEADLIRDKFKFSFYCTLFIIIAAYLHPPLAFFNIFYIYYFYKSLNKLNIFFLILTNIIFLIPVTLFVVENGILFFHKVEGENVDIYTTLNISNKIIIVTTIIFYFLFPILNPIELLKDIIKKMNFFRLSLFFLLTFFLSFFFNYDFTEIHGGGFIHKASYLIFGNYIFLFFISIIVFFTIFENKLINYLIYLLIIFTNIQYTIYNKYYDIIILIIFFLLSEINLEKRFFKQKNNLFYLYSIYLFYYLITLFKSNIYKII